MYVCVCIYAYAYMHAYTYTHRDIPVFHVSHTYTAGIDVHICAYICVCMCLFLQHNGIYAPRLYTRMLYVYDHVLMHVHALTSSLRAASAPSDTSCATVPARPPSLALCKAELL